ncbi:OxaA precursor [Paenibacillus sp. CAA11]|uniref:membrane protein insertase YidC n=1 Tax=Paenibacillus sp. CAA11 TaxID=1532905 RepID=UPI000D3D3868|nr:membrane protein insertase YidC [Paenibacillus sp. CAA11]AWB44811.1 OxaA precursor [Paenibacillus sp. CAA11]
MGSNKGFTSKGRIIGLIGVIMLVLLLSACGTNTKVIDSNTPGFFNHYVVFPLSYLVRHLADWFGGSYGLAIMVITLMVRIALMPLMMKQARNQQKMRRTMNLMKPDLDRIKEKYAGKKDRDAQLKLQEETMAVYKKHQFNPLNIGCLPVLIQLPILSGMYTAIRLTPELSSHSFLWFQLGKPDHMLAIIVAVIYLLQTKLSQKNMPAEQQKQLALMGYISPIMMLVFSFNTPAALPLYWMVGGTFLLLQNLLFRKLYPVEPVEPQDRATQDKIAKA